MYGRCLAPVFQGTGKHGVIRYRGFADGAGDIAVLMRMLYRFETDHSRRPYCLGPFTIRVMIFIGGFGPHIFDRGVWNRNFGFGFYGRELR
jgi:hypothetical protein